MCKRLFQPPCVGRYWRYAIIIFSITFVAVLMGMVQSRKGYVRIREVSLLKVPIRVTRNGQELRAVSDDLVPGDVISIEENMSLPCDCVLLSGETLMSESMLTGESIPVSKSAAHPGMPSTFKSLMAGGTLVLQVRSIKGAPVLARVRSTGFNSEKGRLVRSILYPSAGRDNPQRDGNRFVLFVMVPMAILGGVLVLAYNAAHGAPNTLSFVMDLITIAVPPALPACLVVGISFAVERLHMKRIFCIAPSRVNMAGKITRCCFDKTGTLTIDGLDLLSIHPAGRRNSERPTTFASPIPLDRLRGELNASVDVFYHSALSENMRHVSTVMAACHSIRYLERAESTLQKGKATFPLRPAARSH